MLDESATRLSRLWHRAKYKLSAQLLLVIVLAALWLDWWGLPSTSACDGRSSTPCDHAAFALAGIVGVTGAVLICAIGIARIFLAHRKRARTSLANAIFGTADLG